MTTRAKTLFIVMAILGVFLTVQLNNAMALGGCPDGNVNFFQSEWDGPDQNLCIGQLMPEDLGTFNEDGTFTPNEALYNEIGAWGTTELQFPDFRTEWLPTRAVAPSYTRLDIQWKPDAMPATRFMFQGGATTTFPEIWRVTGPNGEPTGYFMMNFQSAPHEDCDDTQPMPNQDECAISFPQYAQDGGNNCHEIPELCYYAQDEVGTPMCSSNYTNEPGDPWTVDCTGNGALPIVPCMQDNMDCSQFPCNLCGPYPAYWDYNDAAMIADPDINGCCKAGPMWVTFQTITNDFITYNDVESAVWNGLTALPKAARAFNYTYLNYFMGVNEIQNDGSGANGDPEVYFYAFAAGVTPELGLNFVTVTLNDGTQFVVEFDVTSNFEMPTVASKSYFEELVAVSDSKAKSKSKKKLKATLETSEVDNLTARELNGALVIQWAEPEGALTTPNMQLRIYIGDGWFTDEGLETFLFVNAPVQTGTVVIPAVEWSAFKTTMDSLGNTEVNVGGMYRMQTKYNGTDFHNRGYFEGIKFPIN